MHRYFNGADHLGLVGKILDVAGFSWFILEVITMLTNSKRRALHDWIAGTVVVFGD